MKGPIALRPYLSISLLLIGKVSNKINTTLNIEYIGVNYNIFFLFKYIFAMLNNFIKVIFFHHSLNYLLKNTPHSHYDHRENFITMCYVFINLSF